MNKYRGVLIAKQTLKGKIYSGVIKEYPELEQISITPTDEQQIIRPSKYGFNEVVVEPIDFEQTNEYKECLTASNKILNKEEIENE